MDCDVVPLIGVALLELLVFILSYYKLIFTDVKFPATKRVAINRNSKYLWGVINSALRREPDGCRPQNQTSTDPKSKANKMLLNLIVFVNSWYLQKMFFHCISHLYQWHV